MADGSIIIDTKLLDKDFKRGLSGLGNLAKTAGKTLAIGIGVGAAALVGFSAAAIRGAEYAQIAEKRTRAVAKSMNLWGKQSDKVADRLNKLADVQEFQLGVEAEVIKASQAKLLTFAEVGKSADEMGGIFDRATDATIDLAAAGFGTAEQNAVSLGKALQDPIKGITALGRQGVTFTKQEKEKIEALVESGKLLEAQEIILGAVEKQVGGTAEATRRSSDVIKHAFGAVSDELGEQLLPYVDKFADFMTDKVVPAVQTFFDKVEEGVDPLDAFQETMGEVFGTDVSEFVETIKVMLTKLGELRDNAAEVAEAFQKAFADPEVQAQMALMEQTIAAFADSSGDAATDVGELDFSLSGFMTDTLASFNRIANTSKLRMDAIAVAGSTIGIILTGLASPFKTQKDAMRDSSAMAGRFSRSLENIGDTAVRIIGSLPGMNSTLLARIESGFRTAINALIDSLNIAIRAYNKLPVNDISTVPRIGTQSGGTGGRSGQVPLRASGGSSPPNSAHLVVVGDQTSGWEHTLRDDQIVSLMRRAIVSEMARFGSLVVPRQQAQTAQAAGGIVQNITFAQPVRTFSETVAASRMVGLNMAQQL